MGRRHCQRLPRLLRISARAFDDLGLHGSDRTAELAKKRHGIARKFLTDYVHNNHPSGAVVLEAVRDYIRDQKRAGKQVDEHHVERIRFDDDTGAYRAAVWVDPATDIPWLCGVKKISDHGEEPALYESFADDYARGILLPSKDELEFAAREQFIEGYVEALNGTATEAGNHVETWIEAELRLNDGTVTSIGAACVDEYRDADGALIERFVVVCARPPDGPRRPGKASSASPRSGARTRAATSLRPAMTSHLVAHSVLTRCR